MLLYSAPLSFYARKVEIALHEKGLAFERVMVPFSQERGYAPKHPVVLEHSPKGQVPVLVDGALALHDSTLILEYLEDRYPHAPLMPRDAEARARCRMWEHHADETMMGWLRPLMHRTGPRPDDARAWERWEAGALPAEEALASAFVRLDAALASKAYFLEALSIADIGLFIAVLYAGRLGGPAPADGSALAAWRDRLLARCAFARVALEIREADGELSFPLSYPRK